MKYLLTGFIIFCSAHLMAQDNVKEQLFYYSPKGLTFIPPFSKPGLVYNGKLYLGNKKLANLFGTLNDDRLNSYFAKYKANKTPSDIFGFIGGVALPLTNIFVSTNAGKINWPLLAAGIVLGGTGGYLNFQAQKNLLYASIYYDQKMGIPHTYLPQQQSIGFAIALGK